MSLTSFLTQSPAVNSQGTSQTSQSLPQWYNDYVSGILSNAAQFANQGYNPYPGPQVAPLSQQQQSSYNTVNNTTGLGQGIAQQGVNMVNNTLGQQNPLQTANPYLQQANAGIGSALSQPNAAQAGNPYLQQASNPAAGNINSFMNPYTGQMIANNNYLQNLNFTQSTVPALQDQFTAAGQVGGGSRQGVYGDIAAQNLGIGENLAAANIENNAFNTAVPASLQQQSLYGSLGNTAGQLANAAQGTGLYGAGLQAGLGSTAGGLQATGQGLGLSGASALGNLGTTAQNNALQQALVQNQMGQQQQQQTQANYNVGLQNFQQQQQFPLLASQAMGQALQGIQVPGASTGYNYNSPAAGYGLSPLTSALSTYAGVNQLAGLFGGNAARGGHVRYAKGGPVRKTLTLRRFSPLQVACR